MPTPPRKSKRQTNGNEAMKPLIETKLRPQIEKRAYEIWLSSGCEQGNDVSNWLQAENEVLAHLQKSPNEAGKVAIDI
jgi:hypothetical protein